MKKVYIKVLGMTCNHCKHKITMNLKNIELISDVYVNIDKHLVTLKYEENVNIEDVITIITDLGYKTNLSMVFDCEKDFNNAKRDSIYNLIFIFSMILLIYFLVKRMFGFDFLNSIPTIDSTISYSLLFVIGLMTSIHCVGMCGAINLTASMGIKTKHPYKRPILYNLGRLLSYTITGGIAGLIGSVLAPSTFFQGILIGVASVFMLLMGLSMLGMLSKKILSFLPKSSRLSKIKTSSPFILGLLNGLMPCGPLQAMQIYAISTASFFLGAASMFLFALGTIPLMLFVGLLFNFVKGKRVYTMQRISAALVILLAFVMFSRSMGYLGIDFSFSNSEYQIAEIKDGYQYVEIDVLGNAYQKIIVQKDMEVVFNLKVEAGRLNGCNNPIMIPSMGIQKSLLIGDNIVTFTPTSSGTIAYSCWMSMIRSQILVVDDLNTAKNK